jgi:hypothetical protein
MDEFNQKSFPNTLIDHFKQAFYAARKRSRAPHESIGKLSYRKLFEAK